MAHPVDVTPLEAHHFPDAKSAENRERDRDAIRIEGVREERRQLCRCENVLGDDARLIALGRPQLVDPRRHVADQHLVVLRVAEDRHQDPQALVDGARTGSQGLQHRAGIRRLELKALLIARLDDAVRQHLRTQGGTKALDVET
ncbi:hypothetical protein [Povalibacter uvarum]|uniref:hypothetical protein n=1 Tax=Povalibacter uvarum TaxID=732238 RepID=UPI001FEC1B59|nr:hypothetical protein [Povalibacter uvarum]